MALFYLETDQCTGFKHPSPRKQSVTFMKNPAMARLQNILTYWWPTDPEVAQARLVMEFLVASNWEPFFQELRLASDIASFFTIIEVSLRSRFSKVPCQNYRPPRSYNVLGPPQCRYMLIMYWLMRVGRSIISCVVLQGGVYLQAVIDKFSASYATFILAIVFNIALAWVYGVPRLSRDIKAMVGHKVSLYWKILWKGLTPLLLLVSNVILFVWEILLKTLMGVAFFFL